MAPKLPATNKSGLLSLIPIVSVMIGLVAIPAWITHRADERRVSTNETGYMAGVGEWADDQLKSLTLEQKVSQLFSSYAYGYYTSEDHDRYLRLVDLVENFQVGGLLFFQGDPFTQVLLANDMQARAQVPLLMSQDMETGAGMRVSRTTHFPTAMAMGATRDTRLAYAAGHITAREARALGTHQVYAPVADVNNNAFNPVINVRSFGEDPILVSEMVTAFTAGLQDGKVLATAKHFPGHGDTAIDSHNDLPILPFDRARLDSVELVPFRALRDAGILGIMMGHLALPQIEPDSLLPATLTPRIVNDLLREEIGFDGLIISDAMRMQGVTKYFGTGEAAVLAIEAGVDVIILTQDEYAARAAIMNAIEEGRITEERIDESVMRILKAKEWAGLPDKRQIDPSLARQHIATRQHLVLSAATARSAITLTRNEGDILPLVDPPRSILTITLSNSDNSSRGDYFTQRVQERAPQSWVEPRLLDRRSTQADFDDVLREANYTDLILVPTFLPVRTGTGEISLPQRHQRFLDALIAKGKPVVLFSFGSPYIAAALKEQPSAYLAAYGDNLTTQRAAVRALFGESDVAGRLPVSIPDTYPIGSGLEIPQVKPREGFGEEVGMSTAGLSRVDSLLRAAIREKAFPGAAVAIGRDQVLVKKAAHGYFTYDSDERVTTRSQFDLASLTKVIATTTAVMQLYEAGKLDLDATVASILPEFDNNGKDAITIRHLMTHTSGLIPFVPFHQEGITSRDSVLAHIFGSEIVYPPVGSTMKYSDFNMILVGLIVEALSGQPFEEYAKLNIFEPLGMTRTTFREAGQGSDETVVPTEVDNYFRDRLVQGEVHDETAYILGGTAGHAGLFSNAEDLAKFAFMMVNQGSVNGQPFLKPETIEYFTTAINPEHHTRAIGWDTRSLEGYSSAGRLFGPKSYGHTGFTGTSIWIDPDADLFVILLTNRVYPTRNNSAHAPVRAAAADIAYSSIIGPPELVIPTSRERR